jgi:hypothetical protein
MDVVLRRRSIKIEVFGPASRRRDRTIGVNDEAYCQNARMAQTLYDEVFTPLAEQQSP